MNNTKDFSKDYKKFAEDVLGDISKNFTVADYYLEDLPRKIKQAERMIRSIKKQADGQDCSKSVSLFEQRINDIKLLLTKINKIEKKEEKPAWKY